MEIIVNKIINSTTFIMKRLKRVCGLVIIFSIVLTSNIYAQTLERHQAITAYIYNFANNIQWQNEEAINEFQFLIIGEDKDVFNEMKTLSNTKTLRGKPIKIVSKLSVDNFDGVQLIYITKSHENSLTELFDKIEGKNILLISDDFQDKRLVMINFIENENETLRFEINKANIINQNLRFTDDLVIFGGTEIDVAALYRKGQQSLRSIQKHADNLENDLRRLEDAITSKTQEIQVQKDNLDRQMLKMRAQNDSLNKQTLKIQEQQKTLSNESQLLEETKTDIRIQSREIQEQQNILDELSRESIKLQDDLKKGNELLKDQKNKISVQAKNLEEKSGTINKQKNYLNLFVIIIILVIILVFLIYYGYRNKKKLNKILESKVEERTNELRNANDKLLNELNERKLAEEALEMSSALLNEAQTMAKIGGWEFDVNTMVQSWTKETFKIFDLDILDDTPKVPEGVNFYAPEYTQMIDEAVQRAMQYGESYDLECEVDTAKGNRKWVRAIGKANKVNGKIKSVSGSIQDITDRKMAEKALKESEKNLKNTFDLSPSIISKANLDTGYFIDVSNAVTRILGYSVEEFTSKPIMEFIHPDDRQRTIEEIEKQQKGRETISFENRYLCKDGSYKWIAWQATKADENGIVTGIASDITEHKKAEGAVRRLSTAVKQSPSIVVITDIDSNIEFVNPKFTELTGYSIPEVLGKKSNILYSGAQDAAFYSEMWETIESGKVWRGQFHNKKKNGELFWEAASISAILNESGEVINYIKIGEDITQQKISENELNVALEKALESDRLKSAFLANMSHEIRTPMNGILGFISLLNQPNLNKDQIDSYSKIINKSGNRLLNTINDIIDISKIEAGEVDITISEIYLDNELDELFSFYAPEANSNGLSLFIEPSLLTDKVAVLTDGHKLHGILTNLIKNAIKYTEAGAITFGYSLKENFIEFFVKDTGIGIPKNRIHAIFNRFEQADIEDTEVFEGSGLGLAISKAYTEMLGGEIFVESEEGKGSKFTFTIPHTQNQKESVMKTSETVDNITSEFGDLNLLIVDDDEVSSELLEIMLEGVFQKIIIAKTGKEAVELCKNSPEVDLVLMDIKMPVMNGNDATREIRKFNKDLVIIAQTAYVLPGDKEKTIEAGCNDYISKPVNKELLLEIITKRMVKKSS